MIDNINHIKVLHMLKNKKSLLEPKDLLNINIFNLKNKFIKVYNELLPENEIKIKKKKGRC